MRILNIHIFLRTFLGSIDAYVQFEDAQRDGHVAYDLNRAMGRLMLMQQLEGLTRRDRYREAYGAIECVFCDPLDPSKKTKR